MSDRPKVPDKPQRPKHVAIIMDGNGRWARERGLPRLEGHRQGADTVRTITTFARELEIPYLTLFSFSVQNWQRPAEEVAGLMQLLEEYCVKDKKTLMDNHIRLATIGEQSRLPASTRTALSKLIEETADHRAMTLTLAIDYGGREEILAAVKALAKDVKRRRLDPDKLDEAALETRLHTALLPDPDLLIRTSGEMRLSNFMLWQLAFSELYFTEVRWPDFGREHFAAALTTFARRERRFGATSEQLTGGKGDAEGFELGDLPDAADTGVEKEL